MIIFSHKVTVDVAQGKRPTLLDFILEDLLNLLEGFTLLRSWNFVVKVLNLNALVSGSVNDNLDLNSKSLDVLQCMSSKNDEESCKDH